MKIFEEIKQYLPRYLSDDDQKQLFKNLEDFPANIDNRFFTGRLADEGDVFQGDGLRKMLTVRLPNPDLLSGPVMMISNTCDTSFENKRMLPPFLIYCPIVKLSAYERMLLDQGINPARVNGRIQEIKRQQVTDIFYLPHGAGLPEECIALLNQVNSCDVSYVSPETVKEKRLFSLSNYGFYLLIFKLSVHFTRVREQVQRG